MLLLLPSLKEQRAQGVPKNFRKDPWVFIGMYYGEEGKLLQQFEKLMAVVQGAPRMGFSARGAYRRSVGLLAAVIHSFGAYDVFMSLNLQASVEISDV